MRKPDFITAEEAVDRIKSGTTICTIGMTMVSACSEYWKSDFWKKEAQTN